jgi:hypothetical protein
MSELSSGILAVGAALAVTLTAAAFASGGAERAGSGSFVPSSDKARADIWAVGDGADGSSESFDVAKMIARAKPDRFLYLGDVYPKGTAADFAERYEPTYGRLATITAPTIGNHEADNREIGYDPYWRAIHGRTPPSYYAFRIAGWKILSLDSEIDHSPDSPQLRWLQRKVRGPGNCRIAFWHRPWLNAGTTHPGAGSMASFWDVLQDHARLIVNGHEHNMQRQASTQGMVQLIAGSGGNDQYPLDRSYPRLRFGNDTSPGALRLRLKPRSVRFAFVDAEGRVLDSGTSRCRPGA